MQGFGVIIHINNYDLCFKAVLMETQRYANIVPNGVQHTSNRDITVNGLTIPAFTLIQV